MTRLTKQFSGVLLAVLVFIGAVHAVAHVHSGSNECIVCAALPGDRRNSASASPTFEEVSPWSQLEARQTQVESEVETSISQIVSILKTTATPTHREPGAAWPDSTASFWNSPRGICSPRAPPIA